MTAKDLKNALLQEAVQGKLVPQIASEGNARDLLEEIRKEKLSHGLDFANAKSGKRKSKKETALAGSNPCDITEDEIPFDIPESWCWCRLIDVLKDKPSNGISPKEVKYETKIRSLSLSATTSGVFDSNAFKYVELDNNTASKYWLKKNDLLIQRSNSRELVGTSCIYYGDDNLFIYPDLMMRMQVQQNIKLAYIDYVLKSPHVRNYFSKNASGTSDSMPKINQTIVCNTLIPLPPLAEQKRIVSELEKFMPLIEEYGKKETQLKAINEKIGTLTKKAILQEAVQGKLVPHIASEGNARDLLEEIRKEKLSHGLDFANAKSGKRKSKKETALAGSNPCDITEEEIPFDIPESWCWCRLGEIGDWKAGSTPSRSNPELYNGNIPWLKTGDLTDGDINEIPECISKKALESCSMRLNPIGSVLIAMYGATIGKLGILKIEATTNQACCACVPYNGIYNKYLFYYLMSQKKDFTEKAEGGAQPNISREKLVVHLLPLPPYEEQKRIVDTIEKMLPLCEKLGE